MEGNEVRAVAVECNTGTEEATDCENSGSMRPPAELILKASGEPPLKPIVELPLNTPAEPLLDATAKLSLAELPEVSDPDQYESESFSPCGIASASATSSLRERRRLGFGGGVSKKWMDAVSGDQAVGERCERRKGTQGGGNTRERWKVSVFKGITMSRTNRERKDYGGASAGAG
ncbi:hypothetical protein FB451DRAFT_1177964 [Mycena latifolia]|nr:hypothetical protein FB451DRAFT_1177964 [Mycena latifolia]